MESSVLSKPEDIVSYNNDSVTFASRVNIPFPCDCINGEFLGHTFLYELQPGETYTTVANKTFSNLTTDVLMQSFNIYRPTNIPDFGILNVTVNCSCGNSEVSMDYGLFITYPLRPEDTLQSIANQTKIEAELLQRYNPGVDFSQGSGLVFIPGKDQNGSYVPLHPSTGGLIFSLPQNVGLAGGAIAGISIGVIAGVLLLAFCMYIKYHLKKKAQLKNLTMDDSTVNSAGVSKDFGGPSVDGGADITGTTVEESQEFSYKELANATNNFSMANKIGQGGFGVVYYAELRGEKAAIKKMNMKAKREFLAELKVLTHVHHLNLVADCGLTKLAEVGNSTTSAKGTFGYMPPEYDEFFLSLQVIANFAIGACLRYVSGRVSPSPKIDVYAFGVVLYELISAKEAVIQVGAEAKGLVALFNEVFDHQPDPMEGLKNLVDPRLGDNYPIDSVYKMAQLAKACTEGDPQRRPTMRYIVVALMTLTSNTEDWNIASFYENPTLVPLSDQMKLKNGLLLFFLLLEYVCFKVESKCVKGCDLALASYYVMPNIFLEGNITRFMRSTIVSNSDVIISYNKGKIFNNDILLAFLRLNIPFPCDCIGGEFLGHVFEYTTDAGDTYNLIANNYYANLTTVELLKRFNSYDPNHIPANAKINVTINCSCGDSQISEDYGLFVTYPLRTGDTLQVIANQTSLDAELLQSYNPSVNFSKGSGIVFIPGRDQNGDYVPLYPRKTGLATSAAVGISIAGICGLLLLIICIYAKYFKKKEEEKAKLPTEVSVPLSTQDGNASSSAEYETSGSSGPAPGSVAGLTSIMVAKSMEFSYQELAKATNNFSLENKIGQGGFGAVYYAELRGEKTAIKKMDVQASTEFLCELKVLTHVHHLNLVRLIGYCVEGSLFLVYEYIDNGNLGQYLHGTGKDPLPWSSRVQIALDSARGLEYIHEHTVPVYIHRDVKSANILIDKNFRGKVADFGLTKLIEVGNSTLHTRLVGTFGYMPPEYAQYGDVSPKIDVYAFGVVLYELISAKNAILKTGESVVESKGLVALFEEALNQSDPLEGLRKLVDPRLGENYPIDSVLKMAQLGRACTRDNPLLRPSMRSIVVALMTLSSPTEDCDDDTSYENQTLINLLSVR
ncbi:Serine-threonine/tyrosine-protein kinase, catalytic domain [Sesbania bispinosa]|nr:Serine-threonine/tyrosine-protein kinase, catalytic domain [Sesbania bispinosa]